MRALFKGLRACLCLAAWVALSLAWSGCFFGHPDPTRQAQPPPDDSENHMFDPLMKGDRIEIDLRGLPMDVRPSVQDVKQDGTITVENVGLLPAAGLTPRQLEEQITTNLMPAIYKRVTVSVTPLLRYFYVGGQVQHSGGGGRQNYTSAITVTRAIQAAGDFTDFADQRHVRLTRVRDGRIFIIDCKKILKHGAADPQVAPGDQIYVPMRKF